MVIWAPCSSVEKGDLEYVTVGIVGKRTFNGTRQIGHASCAHPAHRLQVRAFQPLTCNPPPISAVVLSSNFSTKHRSRISGSDITRPNFTASGSEVRNSKARRRSALLKPDTVVPSVRISRPPRLRGSDRVPSGIAASPSMAAGPNCEFLPNSALGHRVVPGITRTASAGPYRNPTMKDSRMVAQCTEGVITRETVRYGSLKIW